MTADHDAARMLLGAYVLGGLDAADRRRVEDHLSSCAVCRDEVAELAVLPGLLRRLTPDEAAAGLAPAAPAPRLLASVTRTVQRQRRRRTRLAVAGGLVAAAVTVVALVFGIQAVRSQPPEPSRVVALGPSDGAGRGEAKLVAKQWGTAVTLQAWQMPTEGPFSLEIVGPNGREECAAVWGRTVDGHMVVTGATSLKPEDIRSMTVMTSGHELLHNV